MLLLHSDNSSRDRILHHVDHNFVVYISVEGSHNGDMLFSVKQQRGKTVLLAYFTVEVRVGKNSASFTLVQGSYTSLCCSKFHFLIHSSQSSFAIRLQNLPRQIFAESDEGTH